jgi:hypothetical protein
MIGVELGAMLYGRLWFLNPIGRKNEIRMDLSASMRFVAIRQQQAATPRFPLGQNGSVGLRNPTRATVALLIPVVTTLGVVTMLLELIVEVEEDFSHVAMMDVEVSLQLSVRKREFAVIRKMRNDLSRRFKGDARSHKHGQAGILVSRNE